MKVVDQRLKRLLELRTDSPAMLEALGALASASAESAPASSDERRRNLRSEVERRSLAVIHEMVTTLDPMVHRMLALEESVGALSTACDKARARIDQSEADTAAFLAQAEALAKKREAAEAHWAEVTAFLTQYELKPEEAGVLSAGPSLEDDGQGFFAALARVNEIRGKSLLLITGRDQALGLELLDSATLQQSLALDRLFTWASAICKDSEQLAGGALADVPAAAASLGGGGGDGEDGAPEAGDGGRHRSLFRALRRALSVLHEHRPPYFRSCQDAVVASRRAAFVRRFVRALSSAGGATSGGGGSSGSGGERSGGGGGTEGGDGLRAIHLHAHDPLRYIGDMLAWVHLNIAEEEELLRSLFGTEAQDAYGAAPVAAVGAGGGGGAIAAGARGEAGGDATAPLPAPASGLPALSARFMLAVVTESVARPLAVRVEQVIAAQTVAASYSTAGSSLLAAGSHTGGGVLTVPLTCYRILDILSFYSTTLESLLPQSAGLLTTLAACHHAAVAHFREALSATGQRIRAAPPAYPSDLTASSSVAGAAQQLGELLKVYQASLSSAAEAKMAAAHSASRAIGGGPESGSPSPSHATAAPVRIEEVLDSVLEPMIDTCRASAEGLRVSDTSVFMLNNLSALQSALAPFPFTAGWVQRLASEVAAWEEGLVQQTANDLLNGCGLLHKLSAMHAAAAAAAGGGSAAAPLCRQPGLSPDELRPVVQSFYAELTAPTLISLFDKVSNPRVRSRVRRDTASVLAAAYQRFFEAVASPTSGYAAVCEVHALLRQTPEAVEVLLDLR